MYVGKRVKRFTIRTEKKGRPIRRWHEYIKEDVVAPGQRGQRGRILRIGGSGEG